jgi:hypothetical protein
MAADPPAAPPATPAPATNAPAPAPTTVPVLDQSSPKALLRSFFESRGEVDDATMRSLLHATNPVEQKILDSVVQVELAHARLRAAEKQKFGTSANAPTVTPQGLDAESLRDLGTFVEKVEGDRATVSAPKVPKLAMEFVRVDGRWKLPIASLVGKIDPAAVDTMGTAARAQIEIIDALAGEVKAGKLANPAQVRQELARRFAEKLASATRPATQPAAVPASAPIPPSPKT